MWLQSRWWRPPPPPTQPVLILGEAIQNRSWQKNWVSFKMSNIFERICRADWTFSTGFTRWRCSRTDSEPTRKQLGSENSTAKYNRSIPNRCLIVSHIHNWVRWREFTELRLWSSKRLGTDYDCAIAKIRWIGPFKIGCSLSMVMIPDDTI